MNEREVLRIIENAEEEGSDALDLSKCELHEFPMRILNLNSLKELRLRHNYIAEIPERIDCLKKLKTLDIANNSITVFPITLYDLNRLEILNLASNYITSIPEGISKLRNLTKLFFDGNKLSELPHDICKLEKLEILGIYSNKIDYLPINISDMINLSEIWAKNNNIRELPTKIFSLHNLKILDLIGNPLGLAPEIEKLIEKSADKPESLSQLYKKYYNSPETGNEIRINTSDKNDLPELTSKDIKVFVNNPEKFLNCKIVNFRQAGLNDFPYNILDFYQLESLDLQDNQISVIPPDLMKLKKLKDISFGGNRIENIPPEIGELDQLQTLVIGYNKIKQIPKEIGKLKNLTWLQLRYNELIRIPDEISEIDSLRTFDARNNKIDSLPKCIGRLTNLISLDLENNRISDLPKEIRKLKLLKKLDLRGNPLPIPPEILNLIYEPEKILNYYFEHQKQRKKPLNEAKVLIVGQGAVGKTSLIKRLVDNTFDPNETKTQGIDIKHWNINTNGTSIRLNIWDFGGQEIMHATHQFFLTKRSLYLLVLDSRLDDQENRLEYWLKIIQSFGGNSPIIIVCNKSDEQLLDLDWRGLQKRYPGIRAFVRNVSCKTGDGLSELKTIIEKEISNLDHINDELILSWFQVKNQLEEMKRDYISYAEYQDICEKQEIHYEISRQTLIGFLHDLGIVLHFIDHPVLEETNVLNPEWVTKGVYQVLNSNVLFHSKGELNRKDLNQILDSGDYPKSKHQFIIDMMRHFELCFDFSEYPNQRFLIPDLLSKEEPDTGDWKSSLAFQYHYDVLPGSIISRFIVRMHAYISQKTCWRTGVVLISEDRKNRALVKADPEYKKISIFVNGRENTRRTFLAIIRADFRKIHASIPRLDVKEKVPLQSRPDIVVDYQHLLYLEEEGINTYIPEGYRDVIQVEDLLNGIEPKDQRRSNRDDEEASQSITIRSLKMGDTININAGGDVAFAKDQALVQINKTINEAANISESVEEKLKELTAAVEAMLKGMPEEKAREVTEDLQTFVNEATKEQPRRKWYELSGEGLIEAAKAVGSIGKPVIDTTKMLLKLLAD